MTTPRKRPPGTRTSQRSTRPIPTPPTPRSSRRRSSARPMRPLPEPSARPSEHPPRLLVLTEVATARATATDPRLSNGEEPGPRGPGSLVNCRSCLVAPIQSPPSAGLVGSLGIPGCSCPFVPGRSSTPWSFR